MSIRLSIYLYLRSKVYDTELDYRLTQLELYELKASDEIVEEFRNLWDEGRFENGKFKEFIE